MKKSKQTVPSSDSLRLKITEDEAKLPWLAMLLDAYEIFDRGYHLQPRGNGGSTGEGLPAVRAVTTAAGSRPTSLFIRLR